MDRVNIDKLWEQYYSWDYKVRDCKWIIEATEDFPCDNDEEHAAELTDLYGRLGRSLHKKDKIIVRLRNSGVKI